MSTHPSSGLTSPYVGASLRSVERGRADAVAPCSFARGLATAIAWSLVFWLALVLLLFR